MLGRTPKSTALAGIRILDAGIVQAGPFSTRLPADWGAEPFL
ncbi:MAG: hypothetical protein NTZ05_06930 [Chloroflexi bacterium]|nr:hypothetical protein [Chloroflexota bacterium]